jgi:hypothetical protein
MRRSVCGYLSVFINRLSGGKRGETLCLRWSREYGPNCFACRVVAWLLKEPEHCLTEWLDSFRRK